MYKYRKYVKKYWYSFLLGPLFMILEACGEFILPKINANIIDVGAANKDIPYIIENGIWMVLIAVFMLIAGVLGANFAIRGSARLAAGVRSDVFHRIQKFSFSNIFLEGIFPSMMSQKMHIIQIPHYSISLIHKYLDHRI